MSYIPLLSVKNSQVAIINLILMVIITTLVAPVLVDLGEALGQLQRAPEPPVQLQAHRQPHHPRDLDNSRRQHLPSPGVALRSRYFSNAWEGSRQNTSRDLSRERASELAREKARAKESVSGEREELRGRERPLGGPGSFYTLCCL